MFHYLYISINIDSNLVYYICFIFLTPASLTLFLPHECNLLVTQQASVEQIEKLTAELLATKTELSRTREDLVRHTKFIVLTT